MTKPADTAFPVHELIAERWSPRAFTDEDVSPQTLASLLEAARWAPSCFNEQPWTFLVARRAEGAAFERLAACLVDGNAWAKRASVLCLSVAHTTFERNDKPNRHAWHDVGLATMSLVLQAQALGLATHQMAGFDGERARADLGIPAGHEPVAMIAIGHGGAAELLDEPLREREVAPRARKQLGAIAFGAGWGSALALD